MAEAYSDQHSKKTHQTKQDSVLWSQKKIWSQHNPNSQNTNISAVYTVPWGKEEAEELGTKKWSWAWEERGVGEGEFNFVFASLRPTVFLTGNKQN